jgi:flagellar export protein FliJ
MFTFRLEKVRRHRERQVDHCSQAVQRASLTLAVILRERGALNRLRTQAADQADQDRRHSRQVSLWRWQGNYLAALRRRDLLLDEKELVARRELERRRQELQAAHRNSQVLEKLKERQLRQWEAAQWRLERKQMDEIGSRLARDKAQKLLPQ